MVDGRSLYVADTRNQVIRVIDLDTMIIDRIAGNFQDNGETDVLKSGGVTGHRTRGSALAHRPARLHFAAKLLSNAAISDGEGWGGT